MDKIEVLKNFIDSYHTLIEKLFDPVDVNSIMTKKILFQNYYHDFADFIKNNLEGGDRERYLKKLNRLNQMIGYFFMLPETPMFKVMLIDDYENPKKPQYGKLVRVIEETTAFFEIELDRLNNSKVKFVVSNEIKKVEKIVLLKKAFIVHGHDVATQQKTARFLEQIGFEAIILSEKPSKGMTIIEKLEHYIDADGFGVVLYTPDDEGSAKNIKDYKPRARQNVVFEHGWLIGALGRKKVIQVVTDHNIELPNDISGVVYLSDKGWELDFMNEIHAMGYDVDYNLLRKS